MSRSTSTDIDDAMINMKIAQIQRALQNNMFTYQNDTKWILEKLNNINCQVVATNYLRSKHADWIGNTALHFAADKYKLEGFDILLNHGADFTIKNSDGLTALHLIMQKLANLTSIVSKLDNPFINSVLSAHLKYSNFDICSNSNGLSHFHVACAANNVEAVQGFLQNGVFVNHAVKIDSPIFPGFTSLHFAVKYCAFEVVRLLWSRGANVQIKDATGLTPLYIALKSQLKIMSDVNVNETLRDINEKILLLLLNESNNGIIVTDDWGLSNFHVCCTFKDPRIAEGFFSQRDVNINHTVNVDSPLWPGYTALHFAALCNVDLVRSLMQRGADINVKDAKGVIPFDMCVERYENKDICTIISLHPFWKNIMLSDGKTRLSDLVFAMRDSNQFVTFFSTSNLSDNISVSRGSPLWPGSSPMHLAVLFAKKVVKANEESEQMNLDILKTLCQEYTSMLHSQDVHGRSPLHLAFQLNKRFVLDLLMDFLEKYPILINCLDKDGLSFMHIASAENKIILLSRLISKGLNVNAVYKGKSKFLPMINSGSTPLHFAVIYESTTAVDILVKQGADVYAKDANDMTPIHLLLLSEANTKISDILLSLPNLEDSIARGIGLSHLHVASWHWSTEKSNAVKRLLDSGADINIQIKCRKNLEPNLLLLLKQYENHSPLTIAIKQDNNETVKLLLDSGADIFVKNTNGVGLLYYVLENYESYGDTFSEIVISSEALMARVKAETGMTSLHLACYDLDTDLVEKSLSEGVNVNGQIPPDSPIWPGYSPLHVLMHVSEQCDYDDVMEIAELLLSAGAKVTLQDANLQTAIHLVFNSYYNNNSDNIDCYFMVKRLLEAQRDFRINPTNLSGINHFHIACRICKSRTARKFLNKGGIDINQRIDYFSNTILAGSSALQLVAGSNENVCGFQRQMDTIRLLLNRGADIHTEDHYGDTPLHECTRQHSIELFEKLSRSGGDINARNISGNTPLYCYLESNKKSGESDKILLEVIQTLIRLGCQINTYCTLTRKGYLGQIVDAIPFKDVQKLFSVLPVNFQEKIEVDDLGRTVIHNIVSIEPPRISSEEYVGLIGQLSRVGYDIDDKDELGRTALHLAVKFYNFTAISWLLLAGTDINIADNNGKTALADDFNTWEAWNDRYNVGRTRSQRVRTIETLVIYVKKLKLCGLDVDKQNEDFASKAVEKLRNECALSADFFEELEIVKNTRIKSHSLTLYDFLSETGAVADYPLMSEVKRNDVRKIFSPIGAQRLREHLPELAGILQLQYRKARVRLNLLEQAINTLTFYIGYRFPDDCSHHILVLLKNSELKNLIASANRTENVK